jgi:hypothetical protein
MFRLVGFAVLVFSCPVLFSQQTTTTSCTQAGSNINCDSTTTDYGAQQQQMNQAGQQIGNAIGAGLAVAIQSHRERSWVKKYCASHPGAGWRWYRRSDGATLEAGQCPSMQQEIYLAENAFIARHRDFEPISANAVQINVYIAGHHLDPRREKSYERAFSNLKKQGALQLYAR